MCRCHHAQRWSSCQVPDNGERGRARPCGAWLMAPSDLLECGSHQRQAIVAEEHGRAHEHRWTAEATAGDQLVGVGSQPLLAVLRLDGGEETLALHAGLPGNAGEDDIAGNVL